MASRFKHRTEACYSASLSLCPQLLTQANAVMVALIIKLIRMKCQKPGLAQSRPSKVSIYFIALPSYESACNSLLFQQIHLNIRLRMVINRIVEAC